MTLLQFLLFILSTFSSNQSSSLDLHNMQEIDSIFQVQEIVFHGNKKTKKTFLSRTLDLKINGFYLWSEIEKKVIDLRNISGIYDSQFKCSKSGEGHRIDIYLNEQKTLLPLLNFGFQPTNKWFQAGVVDINFLGRGDELLSYYQNNQGKHSGQVYFRKNNIFQSTYGGHINALRWQSVEPLNFGTSKRFDYQYSLNLVGAGVHLDRNNGFEWELSTSYFSETYKRLREDPSSPRPDFLALQKVLGKIQGKFSNIRYNGIYKDNYEVVVNYQNVYTINNIDFYSIFQFELKHFKRIRRINQLAVRLIGGIADNTISPFAPFVIDAYHNVRGSGDRPLRGSGLVSYNLEWRTELAANSDFTIQAVAFSDGAIIRQSGYETSNIPLKESTLMSVGVGMRLSYSKIVNAVLRVDYAYELTKRNRQFVVGIGQYF